MNNLGKLSETEKEVMQAIWELATPVTVTQLLNIFTSKGWKNPTITTLLSRLIEKGFLTKSMAGKVNYYTPTLTLCEYKEHETQAFLSTVHNGSVKSFIAALVGNTNITNREIAELKEWFQSKAGDI